MLGTNILNQMNRKIKSVTGKSIQTLVHLLNLNVIGLNAKTYHTVEICNLESFAWLEPRGVWGGGVTPLCFLYGDVPLDRVWFFTSLT